MIAFGPVPSRRLGRSLGVNNIPAKHCTYSCTYCQVGRTHGTEIQRRSFYEPDRVVAAVAHKVEECGSLGQRIDYLTFVPDGEPTLDIDLGREIRRLDPLGIPVAVITNGSLLGHSDVRDDLAAATLVSVKIDAGDERGWRRFNRPHARLRFSGLLDGIRAFAAEYRGVLITETMLVPGANDDDATLDTIGGLLAELQPARAYLASPIRPPAEPGVLVPSRRVVAHALAALARRFPRVEPLTEDEEGPFGRTADPVEDLVAILAIHPMREDAARAYLKESEAGGGALDTLLRDRRIERVRYRDRAFVRAARTCSGG